MPQFKFIRICNVKIPFFQGAILFINLIILMRPDGQLMRPFGRLIPRGLSIKAFLWPRRLAAKLTGRYARLPIVFFSGISYSREHPLSFHTRASRNLSGECSMARVRSMANAIAQLLAASPTPFYAVDEQRRIVFCNPACGELVGCAPQELVGRRCDYRPVGESHQVEDVVASLCPPPEAFSGYRSQADVMVMHRLGEVVARRGEYPVDRGGFVLSAGGAAGGGRFRPAGAGREDQEGRKRQGEFDLFHSSILSKIFAEYYRISRF